MDSCQAPGLDGPETQNFSPVSPHLCTQLFLGVLMQPSISVMLSSYHPPTVFCNKSAPIYPIVSKSQLCTEQVLLQTLPSIYWPCQYCPPPGADAQASVNPQSAPNLTRYPWEWAQSSLKVRLVEGIIHPRDCSQEERGPMKIMECFPSGREIGFSLWLMRTACFQFD